MKTQNQKMRHHVTDNCKMYGAHCEAEEPIRYNVSRILKNLFAVYDLNEQLHTCDAGRIRRIL